MPVVSLNDRALLRLSGEDAEPFLQNLITTDLAALPFGEARPGALLSPQGKILFDFLVSRDGSGIRLDVRADVAEALVRRLMLYRLRAKVEISAPEQTDVSVFWDADWGDPEEAAGRSQNDPHGADDLYSDARFSGGPSVLRSYAPRAPTAPPINWTELRIANGVAESGADFALGEVFPHDVLLDENGGLGFRKGCYVGQEVVSRMQHRGTARRRVMIVSAGEALPQPGAEVSAGGRALGTLGSTAGNAGLAIVRIDRVKAALDAGVEILAGGTPVQLTIPPRARYTFPAEASAEEA